MLHAHTDLWDIWSLTRKKKKREIFTEDSLGRSDDVVRHFVIVDLADEKMAFHGHFRFLPASS